MKTIILALCIFAVAFAAPGRGRRPPKTDEDGNTLPPPIKDDVELTEEEFDALIEACEALADDEEKRQDEPELEEVCRELAKMLEEGPKGPRPTQEAEKRGKKGQRTDDDGNTLPPRPKPSKEEFEALIEECEALAGDEKRQDESELEEVCRKLAKMLEEGPKGPRPTQEAEKRGRKGSRTDEDGNTLPPRPKPSKEEVEALIEECEALAEDGEKRQDEPELEEVCRELAKMLEKGPKGPRPTQEAEKRGRKGSKTDEDGNTLPPRPKPSKEEFEALIEECEALAGDEKRQDEPELEEVCRELAKMLEKGPKGPRPTQEAEKRTFRRNGPSQEDTENAGGAIVLGLNTICTGFHELVNAYEELEDEDEKRSWDPVMEGLNNVCSDLEDTQIDELDQNDDGELDRSELDRAAEGLGGALVGLCQGFGELVELATSIGNQKRSWESVFKGLGGVCTDVKTALEADMESAKRGRGGKGPRTDEDGNILPPQPKPSKEEVEALIEECEALAEDGEKRQDDPELEEVCRELAKMLEKGPKGPRPTQEAEKRGGRGPRTDEDGNTLPPRPKGGRGPRTDEDGNTLPPRPKLSKDELEALKEECEALVNDGEKRQDEPALEEVCRKLAKIMRLPRPGKK